LDFVFAVARHLEAHRVGARRAHQHSVLRHEG
jgi:hypothetical protein